MGLMSQLKDLDLGVGQATRAATKRSPAIPDEPGDSLLCRSLCIWSCVSLWEGSVTVDVRSLDDLAGFEGVKAGPKVGFLPKVYFFLGGERKKVAVARFGAHLWGCLLYTSPSPRD